MLLSDSARVRWENHLSGYWDSDVSLKEYCRLHQLSYRSACTWRRRLRSCDAPADPQLEFARISPPSPRRDPALAPSSGIILESGRLHVHLDRGFDRDTLVRVLDILEVR